MANLRNHVDFNTEKGENNQTLSVHRERNTKIPKESFTSKESSFFPLSNV